MKLLYLLTSILLIIGIALIFNLTPKNIANDIKSLFAVKHNLAYRVKLSQGAIKKSKMEAFINEIFSALTAAGKENNFAYLCTFSIFTVIAGFLGTVLTSNFIFLPVSLIVAFFVPYSYAKKISAAYVKDIAEELETALSVITTSYIGSDDLIYAVESSIKYINKPIQYVFMKFLSNAKLINSNIRLAIEEMKFDINNEVFHEWCDNLIECQDNITLKLALQPITARLSDIRIVNGELLTLLQQPKKQYKSMIMLVLINIPILLVINIDWFNALVNTFSGQIVMCIVIAVMLITTILAEKYSKPLEYRR